MNYRLFNVKNEGNNIEYYWLTLNKYFFDDVQMKDLEKLCIWVYSLIGSESDWSGKNENIWNSRN